MPVFSQLWCSLIEEAFDIKVSDRAKAFRMIISELARIKDHLKTFLMMVRSLDCHGYDQSFIHFQEIINSLIYKLCPDKKIFRFSCPGGIQNDISLRWRSECLRALANLNKMLCFWGRIMTQSVTIRRRFESRFIFSRRRFEFFLSGPTLRSCGVNYDTRKEHPYYFYDEVDFEVPLNFTGSSYDRFTVRLEEINQSMRIYPNLLIIYLQGVQFQKR